MNSRLRATAWLLGLLASAIPAVGQDAAKVIHDTYVAGMQRPRPLDMAEAKRIADQVNSLDPQQLEGDARLEALAVRVLVPLALGDAAGARAQLEALRNVAPDDPRTHHLAYFVASAAGDAQLGEEALRELSGHVKGDERRAVSRQRRCMRGVGGPTAEIEIETPSGSFHTVRRGDRALVLHFWNSNDRPQPDEALSALYDWGQQQGHVDFVGVNTDGKPDGDKAAAFATEHGYVWPQHLEGTSRNAPITHEAFNIGSPGWLVVVDVYGFIRAAGDADDPGLVYGLRATAEEAAGTFERVLTRARDGTQASAARPVAPSPPKPQTAEGPQARPPGKGDLPSDPKAADLVRQGRLFMRTGNKIKAKEIFEQVLREYPNTREAREAEEYLQLLP